MRVVSLASSLIIAMTLAMGARALDVDPQLPVYKPVPVGAAQIKSVGSDTLGNLMTGWAADFTKMNPNVKIEIDSQGSSTAPPALLDGASQIGPMSRPMRSEEYEPFEKKYGYHPTSFPVAVDALAIYVNKDNPIQCLTIEQLGSDLLQDSLIQWRKKRYDLGGCRLDGGLGYPPHFALWAEFRLWHA